MTNFCRAETDRYFGSLMRRGCLGRFIHDRESPDVRDQEVIRLDRDTLYSRENAYSLNNLTAKFDADGSCTIQFGGYDDSINCLPTTPGWNYLVRIYRPRGEIREGSWHFPVAELVDEPRSPKQREAGPVEGDR